MKRPSAANSPFFVPVMLLAVFIVIALLALANKAHQPAIEVAAVPSNTAPPLNLLLVTESAKQKRFDLKEMHGQKVIVNYFASWCIPCVTELPMLRKIARQNALAIVGVAYNDNLDAVLNFFSKYGNAYSRVVLDPNGQAAIDWGVRAVPESFLVDEKGNVIAHYPGPITDEVWVNVFARFLPPPVIQ